MSVLEYSIEEKADAYATGEGYLIFKFTPMGQRGWPDKVYISRTGVHVYIEYKRPGKKPRKLQDHRLAQMKGRGCNVHWVDNIDDAKWVLDKYAMEP